MKRIVPLCLALVACSSSTEPSVPASIVFKIGSSCPSVVYNLIIDAETVAERAMVPGDSASFSVAAGPHTAGAVVAEGLVVNIWYPRVVTLSAGQRYVQTLGCG